MLPYADRLQLTAGRDIHIASNTQSSANQIGASRFTRTNLDRVAGLYCKPPRSRATHD